MYDFWFGTRQEIEEDPKKYLLAIKRMLPRWCNSIPDSEYLALYDALYDMELGDQPVLVETGSGSSTIMLAYFAVSRGGELYTWDTNGSKLFYLRSVLNDTLMRCFTERNLSNHWKYVGYASVAPFAGMGMLEELGKQVDACFLDSEHTLDVLMQELAQACKIMGPKGLVAIDDANYSYVSYNTAYINMIRKKQGLPPIEEPPNNTGRHFWEEVGDFLKASFKRVEYVSDTYKTTYQQDIFWAYFRTDREAMSQMDMEKTADLEHRFDAWKVFR